MPRTAEKIHKRLIEQLWVEIPQSGIHSSYSHRCDSRPACVAHDMRHGMMSGRDGHCIDLQQDRREDTPDQVSDNQITVAVADTGTTACVRFNKDDGGLVPFEGPIRFRVIGRIVYAETSILSIGLSIAIQLLGPYRSKRLQ